MKKLGAGVAALVFAAATIFAAAEVDESELKSVNQTIEFENYTGPHSRIDTLEAIKKIGSDLGKVVAQEPEKPQFVGSAAKYYVIHAIDPSEKGKLDADILILGPNAEVDHIRNLRHIIASYLSAAYGYSEADGSTIATFVTVYNAVYRKNLDSFTAKYKGVVVNNLSAEKCGLSTKYSEWPGASQIVIPVSDVSGGLSTVDTSVISDKGVVDSMQEDKDKNLDDRKQMVDIKEREAEKASQKAQESQKKATEKQNQATEEKKKVEEKKQETKKAEQKAEETKKAAEANPNDKKAREEAQAAQKEAETAKAEEKAQEQKAEEKQKEADEAKQEAEQQQATADKKQTEAQNERKEIAKDQQKVEEEKRAEEKAPSVYGLRLVNSASLASQIVKVNTDTGIIMEESPVKVVKGRTMYPANGGFIAVAGENKGKAAVKLVIIDEETLEITKESEETLTDNSVLLADGNAYLVVIKEKAGAFVGKYDGDLNLVKKSPVPINPDSPIIKTSAGYMVTDLAGNPLILDADGLTVTVKRAVGAAVNTGKAASSANER